MSAPSNVVDTMRDVRIQLKEKKRKKNEADIRVENELLAHSRRKKTINIEDDDDANLRLGLLASRMEFEKRNGAGCCSGGGVTSGAGGSCGIKRYFDADLAKGQGDTQQTMETCINKAEYAEDLGRAWSKWFHANDIPGHKANCPYFKAALKLMLSLPKGVPLPRGLDIDGKYLQSNYEELQAYMAAFKNDWGQYGVTVMCDSWTGPSRMRIINFMVFCNGRMHFHKSVNATGCVQNHQYVLERIRKVVVNDIGNWIRQRAFTKAIMKIADEEDAIEAIEQFGQYSSFRGNFDTQMARDGASRLSPTQWWLSFGGDVGTLQKYALRIVSQCTSSSGCERNWSTFALIHTQVRNRLGYEKLHKLVYVHYNLQLRVQQIEGEMKERELDPCGMMLNATLYDNANPIMDWLTNSRSESEPLLDADDYDEEAAAAYEGDYNNRLPTPTHDLVDPVLIEEPLMRPINKRKTRTVNAPIIEEEDEDEVEEETDDDMEDNGENEELPLDDNAAPRQVSTRRRIKSRKLLDTGITSRTSRKEGKSH
ncbi:hypothetical protein ACQ4PT_011657 [Festuca glaucescens]